MFELPFKQWYANENPLCMYDKMFPTFRAFVIDTAFLQSLEQSFLQVLLSLLEKVKV